MGNQPTYPVAVLLDDGTIIVFHSLNEITSEVEPQEAVSLVLVDSSLRGFSISLEGDSTRLNRLASATGVPPRYKLVPINAPLTEALVCKAKAALAESKK